MSGELIDTSIKCDGCGAVADIDNSVMCELCEKRFCEGCIPTKHISDHQVCWGCFDEMISERLSRED